ncbi:hypothetical protein [Rathayibacter iranicus]|uniref:Transmembrane protein n=2 Tax=Rathayibacter iranicus TaxID=59737 RepID=A0AAD1AHR9_9MICO|nr:hypothetical protein [Rathayibacter iranicus]AZZ56934.1 hypothetical protein C7V51_14385 [Rathayibacter iranicus]MWV29534.1 hypothetical protein [Rathayibacter iranicus NCPPB 2253 = VKM Ac-1602]PPI42293.1 hypothetical protein C5E09_13240 [Rathayibacter iranicus]PWJ66616.1 hypothetical protein B0H03_10163 [Rathayibacter iranicus NCPPB 2253 = VKM Ac-1602]
MMLTKPDDARRVDDPELFAADLIATVLLLLGLVVWSLLRSLAGLMLGIWSSLCWAEPCTKAFFAPGTALALGGFWLIIFATVVVSVLRLRRRTLAAVIPLIGLLASSSWFEWLARMSSER